MAGIAAILWAHDWLVDPRRPAQRILQEMEDVPIRAVKDGEWVTVTGMVSGPVVASPFGRGACIGFRLQVRRSRPDLHDPPVVLDREFCPPFTITDDTGTAAVDGPFLFAIPWADEEWSRVKHDRLGILQKLGLETRGNWFSRPRYAYREAWLQPGRRFTVFGLASLEPDPAEQPTDLRSPALKIHLRGSGEQQVVVAYPDKTRNQSLGG